MSNHEAEQSRSPISIRASCFAPFVTVTTVINTNLSKLLHIQNLRIRISGLLVVARVWSRLCALFMLMGDATRKNGLFPHGSGRVFIDVDRSRRQLLVQSCDSIDLCTDHRPGEVRCLGVLLGHTGALTGDPERSEPTGYHGHTSPCFEKTHSAKPRGPSGTRTNTRVTPRRTFNPGHAD